VWRFPDVSLKMGEILMLLSTCDPVEMVPDFESLLQSEEKKMLKRSAF